ncbi:Thg1 C terminal domain-containing protein [Mycena polygramma]|nr:Thg1 C terminal domain-containing protein [Mycena polygramma]
MAGSKYAYVRNFEFPDPLLPGTSMVLRLDGHAFHRFLIRKSASLYNRRQSKIVSTLTSQFTSSYVFRWASYFPDRALKYPPSFDGRLVLYPSAREIRDYFSWRQTDTHINNLYNTAFWALVQEGGESTTEAHATLKGTVSKEKHEIPFSRFGINYNTLDARFRKGSTLVREKIPPDGPLSEAEGIPTTLFPGNVEPTTVRMRTRAKPRTQVEVLHWDIIKDDFWDVRPEILSG